MKTINLNGKEYIEKSYYDELEEKQKEKSIPETPKEQELKLLNNYCALDPTNVCGIYPCIKKCDEDINEIETNMGLFKKIEKPKIRLISDNSFHSEVVKIEGTKYTMEYIHQIKKMGRVWFGEPQIYMRYNKEEKQFMKNEPIMFVYGINLSFVLAPRVESEDEDDE